MFTRATTTSPTFDRLYFVPRLRRAFVAGTIALTAVALTFIVLGMVHRTTWGLVLHSREVSRVANDARALATDRETGVRGFLLSGKNISLRPETEARPLLQAKIDSLIFMTRSASSQNDKAHAIRRAVRLWDYGYAAPTLARAQKPGYVSSSESELAGSALFDNVRAAFQSFQSSEEQFYETLVRSERLGERGAFAAVMIEILLLLGVLVGLRRGALRQATELVEQQEQLEQQAAEMEVHSAEVKEHAALLDIVLDSAPLGFAFHDRDLRYTRINPALAAMAGRSAAEHLGRTPAEVHPDVAAIVEPRLRQVLATGEALFNFPITRPRNAAGTEQHFLLSCFPVKASNGNTEGVGCVVLETTERRLLEGQLLHAQKMEAIGRLAGGIAHDFNNILTAIKSYSELLIEDMTAGKGRIEDVHEIREAADRAANLTRQLLAFGRQQMLRPRVLDLNTTVRDLKSMLGRLIGANIEINTRLAPDVGRITADPGQIEQVLVNLVVNATDAMPEGGRIDVETANVELDAEYASTHVASSAGSYVMLCVSDTGHGMTREIQARVFEPFFTTKEKGKGTGLGLSTVYGIVNQSGGSIWVYSEPGHGATFKIYLPRVDTEADVQVVAALANRLGGTETILLVEDEDSVREVASRTLRRHGYMVVEARNGVDAMRQFTTADSEFDLIVTDIVMPEMGGIELAQRVREWAPQARILFTSGYTEDAVLRRNFLDAAAEFMEKPFTPARLAQRVREVLDAPREVLDAPLTVLAAR